MLSITRNNLVSQTDIVNKSVIQRFSEKSHYDFVDFIIRVNNFYNNEFAVIKNFFNGFIEALDTKILDKFSKLLTDYQIGSDLLNNLIDNSEKITVEHFELAKIWSNILTTLQYIENIPKWLKTSRDNIFIVNVPMFYYNPKKDDTLESIAQMFFNDREKWVDIAKLNDLRYIDVTGDSSWMNRQIKVPLKKVRLKDIQGILDAPIGNYMLGMDIDKNFQFVNDDIKTLNPDDTFSQGCDIMFSLAKGDIPEYPFVGTILGEILGGNQGMLRNTSINYELKRLFYSDSTIKVFVLTNLKVESDALFIDYKIKSINDNVLTGDKRKVDL